MRTPVAILSLVVLASCRGGNKPDASQQTAPGAASSSAPAAAPAKAKGRPNVIFILADDQRADSTACMPRLKKLIGDRGVIFQQSFASTPLCCPGRASVLTGRYAHNHGVLANGDVEDGDEDRVAGAVDFEKNGNHEKVFAKWLRAGGYRTGYFGKYLNGYEKLLKQNDKHVPPHWDEWRAFTHAEYYDFALVEKTLDGKVKTRCFLSDATSKKKTEKKCKKAADETVDDGKENYSTDVLRDQVVEFIERAHKDKKPFFVHFAPKAPHGPFLSPARYQPDPDEPTFTKEAMDRLGQCPLFDWKAPPSYLEADISDKPDWVKDMKGTFRDKKLERIRKMQLVSVLAIEDALEAIVAKLKALGIEDDTVLIYSGDNGYAWGEHHWSGKNCAYEECARVPLMAFDPRVPAGGKKVDAFVLNIDLAPTFADLAGVAPTDKVDGRSLVPLFSGDKGWPRDEILLECWGLGSFGKVGKPDIHAAIRTKQWKYVEHYDDPERKKLHKRKDGDDELELYDLEKDKYETENLARLGPKPLEKLGYDRKAIDATMKDLRARLAKLEAQ